VQYITPVKGVRDELVKMGGDSAALADSPILFPSEKERTRLKVFADLPDDIDAELTDRFLTITGS
jgi:spermidine/putrescine transport system substrate-binding protein